MPVTSVVQTDVLHLAQVQTRVLHTTSEPLRILHTIQHASIQYVLDVDVMLLDSLSREQVSFKSSGK